MVNYKYFCSPQLHQDLAHGSMFKVLLHLNSVLKLFIEEGKLLKKSFSPSVGKKKASKVEYYL